MRKCVDELVMRCSLSTGTNSAGDQTTRRCIINESSLLMQGGAALKWRLSPAGLAYRFSPSFGLAAGRELNKAPNTQDSMR